MEQKHSLSFVILVTFVATLGGLLFGYDTAVISGTTSALKSFFIDPFFVDPNAKELVVKDPVAAMLLIHEYRITIAFCAVIIGLLLSYFLYKMYSQTKASIFTAIMFIVGGAIIYNQYFATTPVLDLSMANSIRGFVISSALVGCIVGGAIGGAVSTSIGRKYGLLLSAVLFAISAAGSGYPDQMNFFGTEVVTSLIIYRIIGGIGVGLASMLSPMYIAEMAPAKYRGMLVSLNQFAIILGMNIVYFVNYFIAKQGDASWLNEIGWRYMFLSELVPAGLFLIMLFFVPETPRFLVLKDKDSKALSVLDRLVGKKEASQELQDIKNSLVQKDAPWLSYGIWIIIVGILLSFFQQAVGINVVLYYAPEIFRNMGAATDISLLQTIIVGIVNLLFTCVAIATVDKFGRKPLMIIGALGMAVSMILLGCTFYFRTIGIGSLILMLLYTASFAMSWGPVTWVLLSEIFPNSIRSAMSIAVAFQWISNLIVSWTFPMMNDSLSLVDKFHNGFAYWIYGIMGILAAFFIWKCVPETKGKTLEDMSKLWKK